MARTSPDEILAEHSADVRRPAAYLRALVLEVVPGASERAYPGWHGIGYRHPRAGYFAGIFPREQTVRLLFEWGALLQDEDGVLQRGGKQTRYGEWTTPEEVPREAMTRLLLEALSIR